MRIGAAARHLGVPAHALRHWEDTGVVVPDRTSSGHRDYTEEHLQRLRVLRACQDAGLTLAEIRKVLRRDEPGRRRVIEERLAAIRRMRTHLEASEAFLSHVLDCRHDFLTRCPQCSGYAQRPGHA